MMHALYVTFWLIIAMACIVGSLICMQEQCRSIAFLLALLAGVALALGVSDCSDLSCFRIIPHAKELR
jgi:hypothetical protein